MQETSSLAELLASLSEDEQQSQIKGLTDAQAAELLRDWRFWARPPQISPWTGGDGKDVDGWMILAGRGWGKTRTGAEVIRDEVESGRSKRIGLIGETAADGRDVLVEGESGILACCGDSKPRFLSSGGGGRPKLIWPNGAIATLYDAREPDQLRGPQHDFLWFDELAKYRYADSLFDMAMFGLRLGDHPRYVITTTPRPIALIRRLLQTAGVVVTRGKSSDNLSNMAPTYKRNVIDRYAGTRLGRQELDAEILEDVPGALWSRRSLDEGRVLRAPALVRIVVAVDPAATSGEGANETGVIVVGMAADKQAYVLDDWSIRGSPDEWARKAVAAYRLHEADCLVAEVNQGGEMVRAVIQSAAPSLPVKMVHASRGKFIRAEPISALYEQGRIHHVGTLPTLEDQMVAFTADIDRGKGSPDRVDALVWGLTELFPAIASREKRERPRLPDFRSADSSMGTLG